MIKIEIEEMEFYAYHGHYAEEQVVGNKFIVNLTLETNKINAIKTDHIEDALNYQTAYKIVSQTMQVKSALLEHVAGRIIDALYNALPEITKATIKVSKINPPMGGKINNVSVTITK